MKKVFLISYVCILALFIASCNTMKKLEKETIETAVIGQVSPQQLTAINGVVNFNYNIAFAPKEFYKKLILKITPKMVYPGGEEKLEPIYFQGIKVKGSNYPVIEYKGNSFSTYNLSFPFKEGMQQGILKADIEATIGNQSVELTPVVLNSNGVKQWKNYAYSLPINTEAIPLFTETFVKDIPATQVGIISGYVLFPLGKSTIPDAQQKTVVMNQAIQQMQHVLANKKAQITNMILFISSSPEGPERLNKDLTDNRFRSSKTYFEQALGLNELQVSKNKKFIIPSLTNENWDGLYLLLEDSNISNKATILQTLKNAQTNTQRSILLEKYIQEIPSLKKNILPLLRRADFFVFYTEKTDVQVEENVTTYYLPQLQEHSVLSLQTDANLLNDLAVLAIQNKQHAKAKKLLEKAITMQQKPEFFNNLGITYMRQGDPRKAKEMFSKAATRKEAKYNMGLILLQEGNYKEAIPYLKTIPNINLAFAELMAGENHAALKTFKNLNLNQGYEYYLMAIAAARNNDMTTMITALKKAIQLDPQLKQRATNDKEFYPYARETLFIDIIQ